jgi:hypothetical protein
MSRPVLKVVGRPTASDDEVRRLALEAGCSPIWRDGILGWAWHCGCPDLRHAMDQQCSVVTPESAGRPIRPVLLCRARGDGSREQGCGRPAVHFYVLVDEEPGGFERDVHPRCSCEEHRHTDVAGSQIWREISYDEALIMTVMQQ